MRTLAIVVILTLSTASAVCWSQVVAIPKPAPYATDNEIAGNIKRECQLGERLADFIAEYAKHRKIDVSLVSETNSTLPGRVLVLEIRDVASEGHAMVGHLTSTVVQGQYYEDTKLIGSFKDRRGSMGGVFGQFRHTCSVLDRTVKAIGKDVAEWMVNPVMDAELGELK